MQRRARLARPNLLFAIQVNSDLWGGQTGRVKYVLARHGTGLVCADGRGRPSYLVFFCLALSLCAELLQFRLDGFDQWAAGVVGQ